jgi:miniconductance mechanosensitive channel
LPAALISVVENVSGAFIILTIALAIGSALDLANVVYSHRPNAHLKPIKGYLQVVAIAIYAVTTVRIIARLIDRSPLILLSGLGAMAAVLMLIFQDTLLSLVASVQISSNDIVRVGDWIEMPELNADGDVIDIALHTIKVQNWDKTITTIPTHTLISDSFRNWRGMSETGARRIKRSLYIDVSSIRFHTSEEVDHFKRFALLKDYIVRKEKELADYNEGLGTKVEAEVNQRRLTNIGTFRAYTLNYLLNHPRIDQEKTLIVRLLAPGPEGLPLEVYCFTNTTEWVAYEGIQSDIFDHLLAIVPAFDLRLFQQPAGSDVLALRAHEQTAGSKKA